MKLSYDCARDLLLCLEENLSSEVNDSATMIHFKKLDLKTVQDKMCDYSMEQLVYTTQKLCEAGFIVADITEINSVIGKIDYMSITYSGHQYLENVRSSTVWQEIKSVFKNKVIELSVNGIMMVAEDIVKKKLLG